MHGVLNIKKDYQTTHNHRGWGLVDLYMLNLIQKFINLLLLYSVAKPVSDTTSLAQFPSTEGLLMIAHHGHYFVPPNTSDKERLLLHLIYYQSATTSSNKIDK